MLFLEEERDSVQRKKKIWIHEWNIFEKKTNVNKVLKIPERNQNILIKKTQIFYTKKALENYVTI